MKNRKIKRSPGHPPLFKTPDELEKKVNEYFSRGLDIIRKVSMTGKVVEVPVATISGLVLFCGFCDRASFYDMEKRPEFSNTIKKARTRIEREYELLLRTQSPTGAIFALKNFGWVDKVDIQHGGDININFKIENASSFMNPSELSFARTRNQN